MGKHKQQVISRFFAPKTKLPTASDSVSSPSLPPLQPPAQNPPTPPPKISATVSYSPSKRLLTSSLTSPSSKPSKIPRLSSPTQLENPIPPQSNPSLHQRFLQKLLEPSDDLSEPSPILPPTNPKYTPLEQQVVELKATYPDVLLMIEVGYKYRFFGKDAENAARVLGIYAHVDHNFLTASVPTFRLHVHVRRLVGAGYKVGVVKQTETAAIKAHGSNRLAPFCRGLSALYTKATLEAAEGIGGSEEGCGSCNNYLVCVADDAVVVENADCPIESGFDVKIGIVGVEVSTGEVVYGEFNDNIMRAGLEAFILSLTPAEILLGEPLTKQTEKLLLAYAGPASNVRVEHASRYCFNEDGALAEVISFYKDMYGDALPGQPSEAIEVTEHANNHLNMERIMAMPCSVVQSLALLIRHLKQFGLERVLCSGASFQPFSGNTDMILSANALQQLEVLKNNSDGSESGSLLHCMDHTLTIFGSRLLRRWVTHPLCDRNMICARLDAVNEILESMQSCTVSKSINSTGLEGSDTAVVKSDLSYVLSSVLTTLRKSPDVQRRLTRIFHRTATATEFVAAIQALLGTGRQLQQLLFEVDEGQNALRSTIRSVLLRKLILTASSSSVIRNATKLMSSLNTEAVDQGDQLNLFNLSCGQFPEVAQARTAVELEKEKLDSLIGLYRKQLGIGKLEFTTVSGTTHLIELSADVRAPPDWVKVNSTKKTIRYHTPSVLTALDQLSLANEELAVVCRAAWDSFLDAFSKYYAEFQSAVHALSALDCLHSLAILARTKNYVRPDFTSDTEPVQIDISAGRHPVLETVLQENFVPNDTHLHAKSQYCQIVTGPNMGGKSCYIRQVALIAIMAQVGSFVPATSAKLHVLDGIHTRMGASDSIQQGRSTFLEELSETSNILKNCTARSLVIIDELGRGTSTHDGVAIAYATLRYLLEQKRSMVLFVTHYPKISEIKNEFPGSVGAFHVSYITAFSGGDRSDSKDHDVIETSHPDVTYLYKLVPGVSERSFGFKVAQLAQLPASCIYRATEMAAKLESAVGERQKQRLAQNVLKERLEIVEEAQKDTCRHNCLYPGSAMILDELTFDYMEFFNKLQSALHEEDLALCFQFLQDAKRIGTKLTDR